LEKGNLTWLATNPNAADANLNFTPCSFSSHIFAATKNWWQRWGDLTKEYYHRLLPKFRLPAIPFSAHAMIVILAPTALQWGRGASN